MDTEKLYDQDAFLREFDAVVTECYEGKDGSCLVTLDRTAFYPEGGGQPADHGVLGGAAVLDVQEREGRVLHTCDRPLPVGRTSAASSTGAAALTTCSSIPASTSSAACSALPFPVTMWVSHGCGYRHHRL